MTNKQRLLKVIRGEIHGPRTAAESLGVTLAEDLLSRGAAAILKAVYAYALGDKQA